MDIALRVAPSGPVARSRRQLLLAGFGVAGLVAAAGSAAIAASGATSHPVSVGVARALIVGVPIGVGLYTWSRRPGERFGLLLAATGGGLFLATLADTRDALPYTVGRTAGWLVEVLLVYLILSFPTGRVSKRGDRLLVGAMALLVLALFLPRLALAQDFEVPSPYTSCIRDCPANAFLLLDHEPAFVDAVMRPIGAALVLAVMIAVLLRLWQRIRDATPLGRRMFTPVLVIGAARVVLVGAGFVARQVDPTGLPVELTSWLIAFAAPAIALAFLVGVLRWEFFAGQVLQRLANRLRAAPDSAALRQAFVDAFKDPTIQMAFPVPDEIDRWRDAGGRAVTMPDPGSGRSATELRDHGAVVAALIHDEALAANPRLLDAGIAMAGVALENQRLAAEAEVAAREARRSRARIVASAERERRRVERDLHDGAQQRLVALRIELELAEDLVRSDPEGGVARLREFEREVDEALEELRSLAHGIYPPLLSDRGLAEALRAAAMRSPLPVEIQANNVGRYSPEVESAVYFCMLEALQNVLKHARAAHRVVIHLDARTGTDLRFSVRDDGAGVHDGSVRPGAGLTNMHDRLAAVGGDVSVSSTPGVGTTVRGHVPTGPQIAV